MEDLDPDYDPEADEFDGPDELMQLDDMEIDVERSELLGYRGKAELGGPNPIPSRSPSPGPAVTRAL